MSFWRRPRFAAVVMAPYFLAIVWQYFSGVQHKTIAWLLAVIVSAIVWVLYQSIDETADERVPWQFWIITALPLLFFYLIRLPFPDISFDVLNYHILHGERALRGPLLIPGDFFPTPAPFNPTPDILTGLYRHVLGYRLGTIVNLAALLWTATIVERLIRDWIRSAWLHSATVFFVVATEQLLFQINNYMVDLLALPLLLEASIIALDPKREQLGRRALRLSLLLGIAAAFKLTNLIYAVPIAVIFVYNVAAVNSRQQIRSLIKTAPIAVLCFVLPLLPFTIFIYRLTGNPVFPLYNGLFKSPYWPQGRLFDPRWGPFGLSETLAWPVKMTFRPERLSEYPFYSGRLSLGFVIALALLFVCRRERRVWQIAFITIVGAILWSASSGYIRYALFLEVTSGILILWIIVSAWQRFSERQTRITFAVSCITLMILLPTPIALARAYKWEWSGRTNIFQQSAQIDLDESRNILRDRYLPAYLAPEDRKAFDKVGLWLETTYKTSAIEALLEPELPIVGVRIPEYFVSAAGRNTIADVLDAQGDT